MSKKRRNSITMVTTAAMMTAISVVIGIFCKNYMNFGVPPGLFRVTFENHPIIMSGILFGPVIGCVVGVLTDLISYLMSSQAYPPNLIVTLGAAMSGAVSGLVAKFIVKKEGEIPDHPFGGAGSPYSLDDNKAYRAVSVLRYSGALANTAVSDHSADRDCDNMLFAQKKKFCPNSRVYRRKQS